ncbi:hypothetical protein M408DRAFT_327909 [Serendipita vermifera MAFF 305830]|uniref:Uncharacterized protein n=1 Tax=Serendipita vermifera MAFF 305830 TaxID=933852 RepID=A0A0C2WY31_SERVB|nr:hypothetical protein M408DRAFT_327909 [Serendipita vermifera MAFF 305830]
MALGNSGSGADSPVLVVISAVAIAIVFVLVMLLIVLRARHMALQRQEAMRLREQWETQLILRFQEKPQLYEIGLSPSASAAQNPNKQPRTEITNHEWERLMPLFAATTSPEAPTYAVGVLLRLPHRHESPGATDTLSGSELHFGLSTLTAR